jgi:hypothetical protein
MFLVRTSDAAARRYLTTFADGLIGWTRDAADAIRYRSKSEARRHAVRLSGAETHEI